MGALSNILHVDLGDHVDRDPDRDHDDQHLRPPGAVDERPPSPPPSYSDEGEHNHGGRAAADVGVDEEEEGRCSEVMVSETQIFEEEELNNMLEMMRKHQSKSKQEPLSRPASRASEGPGWTRETPDP